MMKRCYKITLGLGMLTNSSPWLLDTVTSLLQNKIRDSKDHDTRN